MCEQYLNILITRYDVYEILWMRWFCMCMCLCMIDRHVECQVDRYVERKGHVECQIT